MHPRWQPHHFHEFLYTSLLLVDNPLEDWGNNEGEGEDKEEGHDEAKEEGEVVAEVAWIGHLLLEHQPAGRILQGEGWEESDGTSGLPFG